MSLSGYPARVARAFRQVAL